MVLTLKDLEARREPLFKYMKGEHADGFFRSGTVKVGRLREYRATALYGDLIGDAQEGTVVWSAEHVHIPDWAQYQGPIKGLVECAEGTASVTLEATSVHQDFGGQLVYCVTEEFDPNFKDVYAEDEYDACVRIEQPYAFFHALTWSMMDAGHLARPAMMWGPCIYEGRKPNLTATERGHAAILAKDPKYKAQREVRFAWTPKSDGKGLLIDCPRGIEFCTRLV